MTKTYFHLFAIIFLVSAGFVSSQTDPNSGVTADQRREAGAFFQNQDWQSAAAAYRKIVAAEPKNANARARYGASLLGLNNLREARTELERAAENNQNPNVEFYLARVYSRQNDAARAFAALDKMLQFGGVSRATLTGEKDLSGLTSDERFKQILQKLDFVLHPCTARPEFRQFDFWLGDWVARDPQGNVGGTSSIQMILDSCIIFENWTGAGGTSGKSFNIYDSNDKKWHQTWVDDKGTFTHYIGGMEDGKMVIVADTVIGGVPTLAKMTFTPLANGDVRQFGENSTDNGKTWAAAFDFIYSKKK